jgi:hypothetical protein
MARIIQPWARAIAGKPTEHVFDPKKNELRVTFEDGDAIGPTEIWTGGAEMSVASSDPSEQVRSEDVDGGKVMLVTTPRTGGTHTLCIFPHDAVGGCR